MGTLVTFKTISAVAVAAAGTAVQVSSSEIRTQSVIIQAPVDNTGDIFVGDSSVDSANGIIIRPGNSLDFTGDNMGQGGDFEINLSDLYVDAATNGDEVRVMYVERQ